MLVQPPFESGSVLVNIVVYHQPDGERRAVIRRIKRIVGTHIDGCEDVFLHARIGLDAVLVILEALHSRV